jgi:hypothetical protein
VLDIGDSELSPDILDPDLDDEHGLETRNGENFNNTLENNVKTLHPIQN